MVANTTRHDGIVIREIWIDIKCESVHGYPSAAFYTEGTDFSITDPSARQSINPTGFESKISASTDGHFLECSQISVDVGKMPIKIENGVSSDLPWTMIRDIATSVVSDESGTQPT